MRVEVGASNTNTDNAAQSLSRRERNARDDLPGLPCCCCFLTVLPTLGKERARRSGLESPKMKSK
jgi:hypothetical protein